MGQDSRVVVGEMMRDRFDKLVGEWRESDAFNCSSPSDMVDSSVAGP
jgi:hypothetical protein